jgi:signal transduction histidine kinase
VTRTRSLRTQLVLAFAVLAGCVVLAAGLSTAALIRHAVWAPLDAALEEEAETLNQLGGAAGSLSTVVARIGSETNLGAGKFIRIIARDGSVIGRWGDVPAAVVALPLPAVPAEDGTTVGHDRDAARVVRWLAPDGTWTEIGVHARDRLRMLRHATLAIVGGAGMLLVFLVGLAWEITGRATRELDRLVEELETVEAGSLHRRLVARRTSEVDRLAVVLNRLLARLERALDHLRRFTADAAHELRTPIAALRARIEVTLARGDTAAAYRDGLVDALEQTERLGRLAADLLTLSAVEAVAVPDAPVRLDGIAREVAEFLEPVAQEQGRSFVCRADDPISVRGAEDLLKRMVLNLVDNAFRHTRPGVAVEVAVRGNNGTAEIEVRDAGDGIDDPDPERLFRRFHRGPSSNAGTGLGLALCHEIATRHRGRIALRSAPGRGTVVTVTLPRE